MQGIYIIGVGQLLQHQNFQRRMEGKQTAVWGGGGDLVFTNHHTTLQKIKDFNDLGFFYYKNEEIERKI